MFCAQTNIQLYNQLRQAGWADADLRQVHAGHQLAMTIFAGHFRPNQKPFLAHLVGVASILASGGADATVVTAGLLHSAYSHGEFGDGSRGVTARKRREVGRAIGVACEALIARYADLSWTPSQITALSAHIETLSTADRNVARIRLADLLEDHLDAGLQYSPNKRLAGDSAMEPAWPESAVKLAAALGHYDLAAELGRVLSVRGLAQPPDFLRGPQPGSFVMAPASHGVRTTVRLGRLYRRWLAKLAPARELFRSRAA